MIFSASRSSRCSGGRVWRNSTPDQRSQKALVWSSVGGKPLQLKTCPASFRKLNGRCVTWRPWSRSRPMTFLNETVKRALVVDLAHGVQDDVRERRAVILVVPQMRRNRGHVLRLEHRPHDFLQRRLAGPLDPAPEHRLLHPRRSADDAGAEVLLQQRALLLVIVVARREARLDQARRTMVADACRPV